MSSSGIHSPWMRVFSSLLHVGFLLCCSPIIATLLTSPTVEYLPLLRYVSMQTFMEDLSPQIHF